MIVVSTSYTQSGKHVQEGRYISMKMLVNKDDQLVLIAETEGDFYNLGVLSQKVSHSMTWSKEPLGGGDFCPRQMRIKLEEVLRVMVAPKKGE
jgi:hypothetical protein